MANLERQQRPTVRIERQRSVSSVPGKLARTPLAIGIGAIIALSGCAQLQDPSLAPRALQVDPVYRAGVPAGTAGGHYAVGRIDLASGRVDAAIVRFTNAILLDPEFIDAYNGLGVAHGQARRFPDAIASFREGLRRAPDAPHLLNNLGYALLESGAPSEAVAVLQRSLALDPTNPKTIENLRLLGDAGKPQPASTEVARGESRESIVARQDTGPAHSPGAASTAAALKEPSVAPRSAVELVRVEDTNGRLIPVGPSVFEYRASTRVSEKATPSRAEAVVPAASSQAGTVAPVATSQPGPLAIRETRGDISGRQVHVEAARPGQVTSREEPVTTRTALPEGPAVDRSARKEPARLHAAVSAGNPPPPQVAVVPQRKETTGDQRPARSETAVARPPASSQAVVTPVALRPLRPIQLELSGVEVSNGVGLANLGGRTARRLSKLGVAVVGVRDHWHFGVQQTQILYRDGQRESAEALRRALPVRVRLVSTPTLAEGVNVRLILGRDLTAGEVAFLEGEDAKVASSTQWLPGASSALAALSSDNLSGSALGATAVRPGWRHA